MADENEKNLDDLLMAYELGLLTEDERRRLEIYLLENDELMAEAGSFEGEQLTQNNRKTFRVNVLKDPIKTLLIDELTVGGTGAG